MFRRHIDARNIHIILNQFADLIDHETLRWERIRLRHTKKEFEILILCTSYSRVWFVIVCPILEKNSDWSQYI